MFGRAELEQMLSTMARSGATMLQLVPGCPPCLRLHGRLVRSKADPLELADLEAAVEDLLSCKQSARLAQGADVDGFYSTAGGHRYRYGVVRGSGGISAVFRRVPASIPSFEELGLPELMSSFCYFESGLVLVAGFLGSGKTMTLAALVDRINQTTASHVVTVEKPIELVHESAMSIVHQREVGRQVESFAAGVRDAVRQSADVVVVGDIEDHETLDAALGAAERGCLVLGAVPASSAAAGLEALVARCPEGEDERLLRRLAQVFRALVAQSLVDRSHAQGRVPVLEILIKSQAVTKAILARRFDELPRIMERSHGLGMQTADRGLRNLVGSNVITVEEALYHATDREQIYQRAR